jgi:hypothetical protein
VRSVERSLIVTYRVAVVCVDIRRPPQTIDDRLRAEVIPQADMLDASYWQMELSMKTTSHGSGRQDEMLFSDFCFVIDPWPFAPFYAYLKNSEILRHEEVYQLDGESYFRVQDSLSSII